MCFKTGIECFSLLDGPLEPEHCQKNNGNCIVGRVYRLRKFLSYIIMYSWLGKSSSPFCLFIPLSLSCIKKGNSFPRELLPFVVLLLHCQLFPLKTGKLISTEKKHFKKCGESIPTGTLKKCFRELYGLTEKAIFSRSPPPPPNIF